MDHWRRCRRWSEDEPIRLNKHIRETGHSDSHYRHSLLALGWDFTVKNESEVLQANSYYGPVVWQSQLQRRNSSLIFWNETVQCTKQIRIFRAKNILQTMYWHKAAHSYNVFVMSEGSYLQNEGTWTTLQWFNYQ